MDPLTDRARAFPQRAGLAGRELDGLATGQSPQALFITCSDSRVVPALIAGADPGDLFELRTAGNIVPSYRAHAAAGETATIEYAVDVLGVRDIVVCGHSRCGAIGAVVRGDDLSLTPRRPLVAAQRRPRRSAGRRDGRLRPDRGRAGATARPGPAGPVARLPGHRPAAAGRPGPAPRLVLRVPHRAGARVPVRPRTLPAVVTGSPSTVHPINPRT